MPAASSVDRVRRSLLLAAPALLLGACGTTASVPADPARTLNERLAVGDEAGFLAVFAPSEGAQALAGRIFATLSKQAAEITMTAAGRLRVDWSFPGEPRVASEASIDLIGGRIANLTALTSGAEWLGRSLGVHAAPDLVVAAGTAEHLSRWSRAAEAALAALRQVFPVGRNRSEPVVVLVPDTLAGFAGYAGARAAQLGAVTLVPGLPVSEGVRVVVNPTVAQKSVDDRVLLAHESVHAWMRSPRLTGTPGWLVEGIAEAFTAAIYPQVAETNGRLVRTAIRDGLPNRLPETGEATPTAYALAQLAVRAMVDRVGWPAVLDEADARTHGGARLADSVILAWYREALTRSR